MAKKAIEKAVSLSDAIKEYGDHDGFVFIHKYNVQGYFKYKTDEISDKLLESEVIKIRKGWGGSTCNYAGIAYIIK